MKQSFESHINWLETKLNTLKRNHRFRTQNPLEPETAVHVKLHGRSITLFSSNDYLGLSFHPEIRTAVADAALRYGSGPRGSPLICGYSSIHDELSNEIANLCGTKRALLFPTGYAANLGVITSLAREDVDIFSDQLNHASIVDACRIARQNGARVHIFRHADANHLESLFKQPSSRPKIIVTESIFSTQGDRAPLGAICELKNRYQAWLITDEGHALLVFGEKGGGLAQQLGVSDQVDVQVGTLSKAAAFQGGFAACDQSLADLILNQSRSLIFSTASPIPVVAGLLAALRLISVDTSLKERLWQHVAYVSKRLCKNIESPIVPIILGDEKTTLAASQSLIDRGAHVIGLRPPTVPKDTCRLRVTLSAAHTDADINLLFDALEDLGLIQAAGIKDR